MLCLDEAGGMSTLLLASLPILPSDISSRTRFERGRARSRWPLLSRHDFPLALAQLPDVPTGCCSGTVAVYGGDGISTDAADGGNVWKNAESAAVEKNMPSWLFGSSKKVKIQGGERAEPI